MKICIVGAGSSYTPELIEGLAKMQTELPVTELALYDIDEYRLDTVYGFCLRYAKNLGLDVKITKYTDREKAFDGASFINTQIRVGGNAARANDEKIPLSMGLLGQETTGPGAMMKALRTIPVMIDIARDVEKICPDAWIINYTNPTGMVTEAVMDETNAKIAGLCACGMGPQKIVGDALGVEPNLVRYDMAGLNHMSSAYNFYVAGKRLTDEELDKVYDQFGGSDGREYMKPLGVLANPYMDHYYYPAKKLKYHMDREVCRGEEIIELEKELFREFLDENVIDKPKSLEKRGGGGYSDLALSVMSAIYNNVDSWIVVNVRNNNTLDFLPKEAVIEASCIVNASGIRPISVEQPPKAVQALIFEVKMYEQLAVEAALTGNEDKAIEALLAHPLVRDYEVIPELWSKLLEANRPYLPQFM